MDSESERTPLFDKNLDHNHPSNSGVPAYTAVENNSFWKSGQKTVVLCILFTELCERLTYYSISANLVLFCTSVLNVESPTAITISLAFTGTSYFIPIFGGYIADTVAGKFNTIYGSALLYLVGTTLLPVISYDYGDIHFSEHAKQAYFGIALFLVAIGTGGIKANVGPFGALQLEEFGEGAIRSFFNWFYWFINVGSGISFSVVVYIQQQYSFFYGFLIPTVTIFLANFLLLLQRNKYINHPPEGSALTNIAKITTSSTCGHCCKRNSDLDESSNIQSRFDYAKESNGGKFIDSDVESTKCILRMLPIFGTFVLYWTVYNQMSSTYFLQGERLRLKYSDKFTLPVAVLNLFDVIVILILVPLFDRILYPGLQKLGIDFTLLKRIGTGMILATCSVIVAGIVEIKRKQVMRDGHYISQELSSETFNASDLSVFVQIPQFALIGASEVFASITGLEFAYSQSPVALQGVIMGLFLLTTGLGSYLGSILVMVVNKISGTYGRTKWLPDEPNDGHLEYFFFLLAVLMTLNFIIYLFVASFYEYVKPSTYFEFNGEEASTSGEHRNPVRKKQPSKPEVSSESEM